MAIESLIYPLTPYLWNEEVKVYSDYVNYIFNSNPLEGKRIRDYLYKIFEIEVKKLGYTPKRMRYGDVREDQSPRVIYFEEVIDKADTPYIAEAISNKNKQLRVFYNVSKLCEKLDNAAELSHQSVIILLHEMEHIRQYLGFYNGIVNLEQTRYAKENAIIDSGIQNYYRNHHDECYLEAGADGFGYYLTSQLMKCKINYHFDEIKNKDKDFAEAFQEIQKNAENQGLKRYKEFCNPACFDETDKLFEQLPLYKKIEYIKRFPILSREYNDDGSEKSIENIMECFIEDRAKIEKMVGLSAEVKEDLIDDCYGLYGELIYKRLKKGDNSYEMVDANIDSYPFIKSPFLKCFAGYYEHMIDKYSDNAFYKDALPYFKERSAFFRNYSNNSSYTTQSIKR